MISKKRFINIFRLSTLIQRIFKTSANFVFFERFFSIQNLLHSNTRNRFLSDRVFKLEFIYINRRTLRQKKEKKTRAEKTMQIDELNSYTIIFWFTLTSNQKVILEDAHKSNSESVIVVEDIEFEKENDEIILIENFSFFMNIIIESIVFA